MNSNWDTCFELMLKSEGGYVQHPSDPGGRTNLGVTQATWESWVKRETDEAEMRALTPEKVEPLYKARYWNAVRADELPAGIDYLCFDYAVNAGPNRSIKVLQIALGVASDGDFGPKTLAAVQAADPVKLIDTFSLAKEDFYRSLIQFPVFGKGWLNRVAEVKKIASKMA
jgi:lysozyme family protein